MKGKHWGKLTAQPGTEYQQRSSGPQGRSTSASRSNMLDDRKATPTSYAQRSSGESHASNVSGSMLGDTKGNRDLPPNHTKNTPHGGYRGK